MFALTDPAVVSGGQYFDGVSDTAATARLSRMWGGNNGGFDVVATGTDLTVALSTAYGACTATVSVDGGAATAVTMPTTSNNTWTDVVLFTGLTDAAHSVSFRITGGLQGYVAVDLVNSLTVTGAVPAISIPAGMGQVIFPYLGSYRGSVTSVEGGYIPDRNFNYSFPPQAFCGGIGSSLIRFRAKASSLRVWTNLIGQKYRVMQDGALIGTLVTAPNTSLQDWFQVASGLDVATEHEYAIIAAAVNANFYDYAVMLGGSGAVLNTSPTSLHPDRDAIVFLGDSITEAATLTDVTGSYAFLTANAKGYNLLNLAVSGTASVPWQINEPVGLYDRANLIGQSIRKVPSQIVIMYGHNDGVYANQGITPTMVGNVFTATLTRLAASYPNAKITVLGILDTTAFTSTVRTNLNTAIQNAVTGLANGKVVYVDTTGWINSGTDTLDGTHPTTGGHVKVANQLSPYIPTASTGVVTPGGAPRIGSNLIGAL